jgi:signal peptidase I
MLSWLRQNRRFLLALFLLFVARASLADHYLVPSGSMEYTLLPGDRVFVDKRAYGLRVPLTQIKLLAGASPSPGEVVVFDAPDSGIRLIKRVVAVGGDVVQVRDGHVLINGKPFPRDASGDVERFSERSANLNLTFGGGPDLPPTQVPEGHVFVLGDSRGNSRDSRWFGFVPEAALYAKALGVYYRSGEGFVWVPL